MLGYDSFKLSGPNILKGLKRGSKPGTIIAYCGGWKTLEENNKRIPCGKNPLFLGEPETEQCKECGYLICPDCDTCNVLCKRMIQKISTTPEKISLEESGADASLVDSLYNGHNDKPWHQRSSYRAERALEKNNAGL